MRIKHVFRVVGSQFINATELNEFLIDTAKTHIDMSPKVSGKASHV
jgi:hypothetical protein